MPASHPKAEYRKVPGLLFIGRIYWIQRKTQEQERLVMQWRHLFLLVLVGVSSCAMGPPRAKDGMALIEGVYIRGEGRIGTVGRIFAVRRDDTGETLKLGSYSHSLDVPPGRYTVKYICHLTTDRDYRAFVARNRHLVKQDTVTLSAGDILYARAVSAAELGSRGLQPSIRRAWCDTELRIARNQP